jgi:hypothetical protein
MLVRHIEARRDQDGFYLYGRLRTGRRALAAVPGLLASSTRAPVGVHISTTGVIAGRSASMASNSLLVSVRVTRIGSLQFDYEGGPPSLASSRQKICDTTVGRVC